MGIDTDGSPMRAASVKARHSSSGIASACESAK